MKSLEIKKDIHWVGALDPDLRIFDIIMYTPYGTSYNSYVIKGSEKTALFETVKAKFFDEYLERLKALDIDITKIDYIIVDHTEPDHAGSVSKLLEISPNAKVVGSSCAISFLKDIVNRDFEAISVNDGSEINLGNKTLKFISAPFLHWPDSIYTYIVEDEVLITCDSFGSHYSSENIINSKIENNDHYIEALKYYFDNIFGPYKPYVLSAIDKIKDLKIDMILPGHGPVLVENPMEIVNLYNEWSTPKEAKNKNKVVTISYVSAYGYTESLAKEIARGIESVNNTETRLFNVIESDINNILESIEESDGILFGSPTIVGELLPPIRDVLTKLNPIINGGKLAAAFGSYGWSGEAIPRIETRLHELNMKVFEPGLKIKFKPSDDELKEAFNFGVKFAETLMGKREFLSSNNNSNDSNVSNNKNKKGDIESMSNAGKPKLWKCVICGIIMESETVPEICPVCDAGSDQFIEVPREDSKFFSDKEETILIIGNGAAGFYAAKAIRERSKNAMIKLISNEPEHSYVRTQLSDLITDDPDNTFYLEKENWYKENNIVEILNVNVNAINKEDNSIELDNNEKVKYDKLILANGSYNFVPPTKVKYNNSENEISSENYTTVKGVHTIKKLADVKTIKDEIPVAKSVVVIGGGLLGLEAAWELQRRNVKVSVIELSDRLLPRQLDAEGSKLFEVAIKHVPVEILLGESVDFISADKDGVKSVHLKSGKVIDADMVIYSVGVRSNILLAKTAEIELNRGIVVDEEMRTNISNIFACGDVAELNGIYYGNWPAAIEMGTVAGANAAGDNIKFEKFVSSTIFSAMEVNVFSAGSINFDDPTLERLSSIDAENNKYTKLFFNNNKLVGGILIGDLSPSAKIIEGIQNGDDKDSVISKKIL